MSTLEMVVSELCSLRRSLSTQARIDSVTGGDGLDAVKEQQAASIRAKIAYISEYDATSHERLLDAIEAAAPDFGAVNTQVMVAAANARLCTVHAKLASRRRGSGAKIHRPQLIASIVPYLTKLDWEVLRDTRLPISMKLCRMATRLNRWGVQHLSQQSRMEPVAILLCLHYGLKAMGTQKGPSFK